MWIILLLSLRLVLCALIPERIPHRSVYNFAGMISTVTGRNPMDFVNYGNWCGLGGSGDPMDDTDMCCQKHDLCYTLYLHNERCTRGLLYNLAVYLNNYQWEHDDLTNEIICKNSNSECRQYLCNCDKTCAECLSLSTYNPELNNMRHKL